MSEFFDGARIKVFGVGGAGGNAVAHMIAEGMTGVEFIVANTDAQALQRCAVHALPLQLGNNGLGAGGQPEKGQAAAQQQREVIKQHLMGANMVFITAGMGGGTGTGAAPVIADVAREMGILVVGVVTKPFQFEGARRMKAANSGIENMARSVDALIVILNERLMTELGEDVDMADAFAAADNVLKQAVAGIVEIITVEGLVNRDFEDVRTVMGGKGRSMMGSGVASGENRAMDAVKAAVSSPLLEGQLSGAKGILVNITASRAGLRMSEINKIMATVNQFAAEDAHVLFGAVWDDSLGDAMRVTVVATGLDDLAAVQQATGYGQMQQRAGVGAPGYVGGRVPARPAMATGPTPLTLAEMHQNAAHAMHEQRFVPGAERAPAGPGLTPAQAAQRRPGLGATVPRTVTSVMGRDDSQDSVPAYMRRGGAAPMPG